MHRVTERRVDEPAEGEPEHPRVVVQDVELVGFEERVHRVFHLPVGVPDPFARRRVEDRLEPRSRLRVTDAKSVTSWPASTSPSARSATTRSVPPYASGGTGNHTGQTSPICIYTPSAIVTWPRSTATVHVLPYALMPSIRNPSSQLGSSSVTVETSR